VRQLDVTRVLIASCGVAILLCGLSLVGSALVIGRVASYARAEVLEERLDEVEQKSVRITIYDFLESTYRADTRHQVFYGMAVSVLAAIMLGLLLIAWRKSAPASMASKSSVV
jgi:hypothetical protein